MNDKKAINLKPSDYQPSKAELEQSITPDVPGETLKEQMDTFADAVMQSAKVEYEKS